jgi:hypothetical protein
VRDEGVAVADRHAQGLGRRPITGNPGGNGGVDVSGQSWVISVVQQRQHIDDVALASGHSMFACGETDIVMVLEAHHAELQCLRVDLVARK